MTRYKLNLKELGYSAHAIHNHRGAFYYRNTVFANMGFDTFTCLEYMRVKQLWKRKCHEKGSEKVVTGTSLGGW